MKKIIFLLFAVFFVLFEGTYSANAVLNSKNDDPSIREIRINVFVISGGKPRPRPRSGIEIITAELDITAQQLFLEFNEAVGKVKIQVKNSMGQIVSVYSCDTEMEPIAIMSISNYADYYTISIIGEGIEAYGYYEISDSK